MKNFLWVFIVVFVFSSKVFSQIPIIDDFSRDVVDGWGTTDGNQYRHWSPLGDTDSFSVIGYKGIIDLQNNNDNEIITINTPYLNAEVSTTLSLDGIPNMQYNTGLIVRNNPSNRFDYYYLRLYDINTDGNVGFSIDKFVGGQSTHLAFANLRATLEESKDYHIRMQVLGTNPTMLRAKFWALGHPEPSNWSIELSDNEASLQVEGYVGVKAKMASGDNSAMSISFDSLSIFNLDNTYVANELGNLPPALDQNDCIWKNWAATQQVAMCPVGQYVAGHEGTGITTGSKLNFGRILCCTP